MWQMSLKTFFLILKVIHDEIGLISNNLIRNSIDLKIKESLE